MKNVKKKSMIAAFIVMVVLAGCGSKEVVMKEFTSKDQTVSIQMNKEWVVQEGIVEEELSWAAEGWIAMASEMDLRQLLLRRCRNIFITSVTWIILRNW